MDQWIIKTKANLRDALFALLETQTLNKISVTDLCNQAHISRRTFYTYYQTADDVFVEYQEELYDQFKNMLSPLRDRNFVILDTIDSIVTDNFHALK